MNEQRLAEIEAEHDGCEGYVDTMELVAEVRKLQARLDAMKLAGTRFSNWAFNVSQQPELAEGQGESLRNMVRDWDAAVRGEARDEA